MLVSSSTNHRQAGKLLIVNMYLFRVQNVTKQPSHIHEKFLVGEVTIVYLNIKNAHYNIY